jgi:hypothetical protein
MSAQRDLPALYAEWRRLTEQEADAIRSAQWDRLDSIQNAKRELQPLIVAASERAQSAAPALGEAQATSATILELIALEKRNAALLAAQSEAAREVRAHWDRSSRNLRQIQQSYSGLHRSNWAGYG